MLARLPVIVSKRCGCVSELVKEGVNGFSFDPNNELKLTKLMQGFVNGSYNIKSMGEASFAIVRKHSPSVIAQNIATGIKAYI
jgi:glycosyltransferase involved in cell wall biosynthesis